MILEKMRIIDIRKEPEYSTVAIKYFQDKWATKESLKVYEDSINRSLETENPIPIWYLLESDKKIIGCCGIITNDFISCMDLYPWLCALYIEEGSRGSSLGKLLIEQCIEDVRKLGYNSLYLSTDHIGYYEKYGFKYIGTGYHPWGESSRVYEYKII